MSAEDKMKQVIEDCLPDIYNKLVENGFKFDNECDFID